MKRVFIDTNVMLDFLSQREPHFAAAEKLFALSCHRKIQIAASSLSFITSHYVLSKHGLSEASIRKMLKNMHTMCEVIKVGTATILDAINSTFEDMEDGLQHLCAIDAKAEVLVTRNEKDFKASQITVMHPTEFISFFTNLR